MTPFMTRRGTRGFTLIEVLVAVSIVAVALAAGARAAGALTDNAERLAQVSAAHWCADNQLTNLRLSRTLPGIGDARAKAIVKGRPYSGKDDLVKKTVLSEGVYDKLKDLVIARQK